MKIPNRIQPLVDDGLIDDVLQRLKSGKEADVYTVLCGGKVQCAKVYKEATQRSFKQAVQYQEGRKTRNSRNARAMQKGTKFGRKQQEESWQTAEVDALFRLANAGVRVPQPYLCIDGVLLMELVTDANGSVAPRLSDVSLSEEQAVTDFHTMIRNIVRMLCAGIVHGDLSEFNVLLDEQGPVIIDLPQAVDAAANNHAESMFERDVDNITSYYGQFAPQLLKTRYAKEIWLLYEDGKLTPETPLTGKFVEEERVVDMDSLMDEIITAEDEYYERQRASRERDEE
ncbi:MULTISPECIES: PA4780 family RIO1-like protein kinase [Pantoea]|jgi:RIO kinase 1|uniref:non-specific serine/threonine protein kinase n=1 Tax=[Curtobacterium] plantarum TaxID=221276 RepID=A0ABT9TB73_9GAMM|nr:MULTISPECIES: PA4780 family RIO1-like protein kinase [Pantoea]EZI33593.1 RIO-type serine/threonine protein kinase [Pantoea agglomerans]KAF6637233.1 serine protein kinase RIO [Pantoea sp. EKM10T]KPA06941.1 RIO-type serine/threonine protein kinase [Pantoea agglomerans]MBA8868994.1 RIO kinase 1 [Pantoea agglomerans]MBA8873996.1 RIO kinase 1 [Pantoea agglomerans]